jgi:hypothetical protein
LPACGQENRSGRRFCGECGKKLVLRCTACRADNDPDEKFCAGVLGTDAVESIMSRCERFRIVYASWIAGNGASALD